MTLLADLEALERECRQRAAFEREAAALPGSTIAGAAHEARASELEAIAGRLATLRAGVVGEDAVERALKRMQERVQETGGALPNSWIRWQHDTYARIADELTAALGRTDTGEG